MQRPRCGNLLLIIRHIHGGTQRLVDLLDVGAASTAARGRGTAVAAHAAHAAHVGHAGLTGAALIDLGHDRHGNALELLLLGLVLLDLRVLVGLEPRDGLVDLGRERRLVTLLELAGHLVVRHGVLERVRVVLERVLGVHLLALALVLLLEALSLLHHALDVLLRQAALVVGDGDLLALSSPLVLSRHLQDTVGVDLERHLDLRHAAGGGRDVAELELAEKMAVLGHRAFALKHLDEHGRLVVLRSRESLRLLGGDHGVAANELGQYSADSLDTERERGHVEEEEVRCLSATLAREDTALHRRAVGHSLVRVDALVRLLAVEEILEQLLHLRDTGRTADQHELVDLALLERGVLEHLLDRDERLLEEIHAELLELGAGDVGVEVDAVKRRVDLDGRLGGRGQSALGALASSADAAEGTRVVRRILLVLALEVLDAVRHKAVVEVLTAQMGVASSGLHLKDSVVDGQERHIEGASTKIVDKDVPLARGLLLKTIRDSRGGRLVDDAKNVEASDHTGILGGLALGVVEVSRDSDHSVLHVLAEESLSGLLHLGEHHGGDLLRAEGLGLALELNLHVRLLALLGDNLEREVLHVVHDGGIVHLAANQTLSIKDGVVRVHGRLVLGGISDQTL
mmetsp:Transcript_8364/g.13279  ORF Transcript_8364/g.13279 Transcript_8364/m.13279 type:complete len:629 (+) Transcript_8364:30-1916(+)